MYIHFMCVFVRRYLCCVVTGHRISEQIDGSEFKVRLYTYACFKYVHSYILVRILLFITTY